MGNPNSNDPLLQAQEITGVSSRFRDDFESGWAPKWNLKIANAADAAGITTDLSNGLTLVKDTAVSEFLLVSKASFTIPCRLTFAINMAGRQNNQTIEVGFVELNDDGSPNLSRRAGFAFDGPTNTVCKNRNVLNTQFGDATLTVSATTTPQVYTLDASVDEHWFMTVGGLNSPNAKQSVAKADRWLLNPDKMHSVYFRVLNSAVVAANTIKLAYVAVEDYNEIMSEINGGRGGGEGSRSIPTAIANTPPVIPNPSASTGGGSSNINIIAAAGTNAALLKASAANLVELYASNLTASFKFVKLFNKSTAPVPGTDTPIRTYAIPPNSTIVLNTVAGARVFTSGLGIAITGGAAALDATPVAAADVIVGGTYV